MATAQVVQALIEHAWLSLLIPTTWLVLKLTHTAAHIVCTRAWDRVLRCSGVPEDERRKRVFGYDVVAGRYPW